ncbi:MAG: aspartate carbamoyltransferase, partial [Elusimicrobia bacterium]|nr:aspartate carbamoyltransferase [Elusimicrobiota bacterium]
IQDEYDAGGESKAVDYAPFHLTRARLALLPEGAVVMHPLPRREEIPPELDDDPRVVVFRQERNGMWARAALIAHILGVDGAVLDRRY